MSSNSLPSSSAVISFLTRDSRRWVLGCQQHFEMLLELGMRQRRAATQRVRLRAAEAQWVSAAIGAVKADER